VKAQTPSARSNRAPSAISWSIGREVDCAYLEDRRARKRSRVQILDTPPIQDDAAHGTANRRLAIGRPSGAGGAIDGCLLSSMAERPDVARLTRGSNPPAGTRYARFIRHAPVVQLAETAASDTAWCRFNSCPEHQFNTEMMKHRSPGQMGRQGSYTPLLSRFDSCGDYHHLTRSSHSPLSQWQRKRPITVGRRFDSSREDQLTTSGGGTTQALASPVSKETIMNNGGKRRSGHVTGAAIGPGF
jgi:hypothetical protein